jgi:hypothetical protein
MCREGLALILHLDVHTQIHVYVQTDRDRESYPLHRKLVGGHLCHEPPNNPLYPHCLQAASAMPTHPPPAPSAAAGATSFTNGSAYMSWMGKFSEPPPRERQDARGLKAPGVSQDVIVQIQRAPVVFLAMPYQRLLFTAAATAAARVSPVTSQAMQRRKLWLTSQLSLGAAWLSQGGRRSRWWRGRRRGKGGETSEACSGKDE